MKIIYHCYGGSHSSVIAAAIHLGLLPTDRIPTREEILRIAYYDTQEPCDHGRIFHMGRDLDGHEVYFMGRRLCEDVVIRALLGVGRIFGIDTGEVIFVNTMSCVNWLMMVGGSFSRAMRLIAVGRPLVVKGTQQCYARLTELVISVKTKLQACPSATPSAEALRQ